MKLSALVLLGKCEGNAADISHLVHETVEGRREIHAEVLQDLFDIGLELGGGPRKVMVAVAHMKGFSFVNKDEDIVSKISYVINTACYGVSYIYDSLVIAVSGTDHLESSSPISADAVEFQLCSRLRMGGRISRRNAPT